MKCYLTTPVFREIANHPKVSMKKKERILELWNRLEEATNLKVSDKRFPSNCDIEETIRNWGAHIIGCHLSHPISSEMLKDSNVIAVCTSTAGYNHIAQEPGILITHTPGVLHHTVADFTISVILANLRNIVELHNYVWNGDWQAGQKWDLDENINQTIENLTLGIVGLGEIGKELVKRLYPWGIKIVYNDIQPQEEIEKKYSRIQFYDSLEALFAQSDIVSLHVPLMKSTYHLVGEELLKKMKKGALLVNTARGPIVDFQALLKLLENKEIEINLSFDVYEQEPIDDSTLERFKNVVTQNPFLRFIFIPHNASADSETRAKMAIMILEDMISIAESNSGEDLSSIRLIPEQRKLRDEKKYYNFKINNMWGNKKN